MVEHSPLILEVRGSILTPSIMLGYFLSMLYMLGYFLSMLYMFLRLVALVGVSKSGMNQYIFISFGRLIYIYLSERATVAVTLLQTNR